MQTKVTRGASADHLLVKSITPSQGEAVDLGTITVLVGPNNSGKSESLRDILRLAANVESAAGQPDSGDDLETVVIRDLAFVSKLTMDRLTQGLTVIGDAGSTEGLVVQGIGPDLKTPYRRSVASELKNILYRPVMTARSVRLTSLGELMPLRVAYLAAGLHRQLFEPAMACSPRQAPENLLQALHYADEDMHSELDAAFTSIFPGLHVRLDSTERINLYLRLAAEFPELSNDPVESVSQYAALRRVDEEGDGYQSVLATVLTILMCKGRLVLLDQPDAFLHPAQARQLGVWIANNAARLGCQLFVATHGVAMLNGLLEGAADATIVRLSRSGDSTALHAVPADIANALAEFPLLASQRSLECLFSEGVVVVPRGNDRVVYETVANRFLQGTSVRFLHSHGSRNLGFVARTLRQVGVPTCVVAELESFQSEKGFSDLLDAVTGSPPPAPWLATRERLAKHVEGMFDARELSASAHEVESFLDDFKKGGSLNATTGPALSSPDPREKWSRLQRQQLSGLPQEVLVWVEELLDDLKHKGVFVSPKGGFQGWFPLETSDDENWFAKAIQNLHKGVCPADLRAFVTDVLAHVRALGLPLRAARTSKSSN